MAEDNNIVLRCRAIVAATQSQSFAADAIKHRYCPIAAGTAATVANDFTTATASYSTAEDWLNNIKIIMRSPSATVIVLRRDYNENRGL